MEIYRQINGLMQKFSHIVSRIWNIEVLRKNFKDFKNDASSILAYLFTCREHPADSSLVRLHPSDFCLSENGKMEHDPVAILIDIILRQSVSGN